MSFELSIPYVPTLQPDELLYSYLGRTAELNSLGAAKSRLRKFFGTDSKVAVVDLPTGLSSLQAQLGNNSPWKTIDEVIDSATVYPYHRPFLASVRRARVEQILMSGEGKALKALMGRVANGFGASPPLRFCAECRTLDIATCGFPYWHRAHQLPGVCCCYAHGCALTCVKLNSASDKLRFCLVPAATSEWLPSDAIDAQQIEFAAMSRELLDLRLGTTDTGNLCKTYANKAIEQGFRFAQGVDYRSLASAMLSRYRNFRGFTHRARLLSSESDPLCWLKSVIGRPDRSSHPICHLLLINFLYESVSNFASVALNPNKRDTRESSADAMLQCAGFSSMPVSLESRLRDSTLSCRQVAHGVGLSVITIVCMRKKLGLAVATRPKYLDSARVAAIVNHLNNGIPPRDVSAMTGSSLATVYRIRAIHAHEQPPSTQSALDAKVEIRRLRWIRNIESGVGGVTAARALAPADYAWLYRHDRKWLLAKRPVTKRIYHEKRVNWRERDLAYCDIIHENFAKLTSVSHYRRVSRSALLRGLDDAQIRANLSELPKVTVLVSQLVETTLEFQLRRISDAVTILHRQGVVPTGWRVQKMAQIARWSEAHSTHTQTECTRLGTPSVHINDQNR